MINTWFNQTLLSEYCKDQNVYNWLIDDANLTEKLKKTNIKFSLRLLEQSVGTPYTDEIDVVGSKVALIRKVVHEFDNVPYIFARVIVPEVTYLKYKTILDNLGNAPIGTNFLYCDQEITRKPFEYKLINPNDMAYVEINNLHQNIKNHYWARRSIFMLRHGILLISEFFLNTKF